MITALTLKNFKQHVDSHFVFTPGLNIIQGENGAGKTSILKGILFALGGVSAAGSKDHLGTWGGGNPEVTAKVILSGVEHEIVRSFTKATITSNGQLLASGQSPVTKYIEDSLGMPIKVLKSLLCAEQGETQALLKMGAAGLQAKLEQVAKTEVIDQVLRLLTLDTSELNGELKGIGELLNVSVLETRLGEVKVETSQARNVLAEIGDTLSDSKLLVNNYTAKLSEKQELVKIAQKYAADKSRLETYLEVEGKKLAHAEAELVQGDPTQLTQDIESLENVINEVAKNYASAVRAEADIAAFERELAKKKANYETLSSQTDLYKEAAAVEKDLLKLQVETRDLNVLLVKAENAVSEAACSSCKRPFDEKALAEAEVLAKESKVKYRESSDALHKVRERFQTYGLSSNDIANFEQKLQNAKEQYESALATETPEVLVFAEELKTQQAELQIELNNLKETRGQVVRTQSAYKRALTEVEEIQEQLEQLVAPDFSLDEVNSEINVIGDKLQEARNCVSAASVAEAKVTEQLRALDAESKRLQDQIDETLAKVERQRTVTERLSSLSALSKFLRENRSKLVQDSWDSLIQYASYLINSTTEGFMSNLSRDSSGDFFIEEDGRAVPVEELSGARKSIVGLSLRIALAQVFYGSQGFTLLDEATADCTEVNAARIAGMLQTLNSQVIMVSHRQGDVSNARNVIIL